MSIRLYKVFFDAFDSVCGLSCNQKERVLFEVYIFGQFVVGKYKIRQFRLAANHDQLIGGAQTDALIYLMYVLFFIAIIATVVGVVFQFGSALKDNPGAALKSLIGLVILVAVVVISWAMGSEEPLVIPGYSGTENVPFWLKLTDMFLYSIYILFAGTILAIIFSSIKKKLS